MIIIIKSEKDHPERVTTKYIESNYIDVFENTETGTSNRIGYYRNMLYDTINIKEIIQIASVNSKNHNIIVQKVMELMNKLGNTQKIDITDTDFEILYHIFKVNYQIGNYSEWEEYLNNLSTDKGFSDSGLPLSIISEFLKISQEYLRERLGSLSYKGLIHQVSNNKWDLAGRFRKYILSKGKVPSKEQLRKAIVNNFEMNIISKSDFLEKNLIKVVKFPEFPEWRVQK